MEAVKGEDIDVFDDEAVGFAMIKDRLVADKRRVLESL
jgi:hypothetical protein